MSNRYTTRAIILKTEAKGEYDLWCTCFTEKFGKMRLFAKAVRKSASKLRPALQPLSCSTIEFVEGRVWRIVDAVLQERHEELRSKTQSMQSALAVSALCNRFAQEKEQDQALWKHLLEALEMLNAKGQSASVASLAYYHFLWNLLKRSGYAPAPEDLKKEAPRALHSVTSLLAEPLGYVETLQLAATDREELARISREYLERALILVS